MQSSDQMTENTGFSENQPTAATGSTHDRLVENISGLIAPLGYEVVHLETHTGRQKLIRLFIDRLDGSGIGIEDCVQVTRALDEPLDAMAEVSAIFKDSFYELEVSSPGVDRPLRQDKDFVRFAGREVRIHVFRPLNAEELENPVYAEKNPRQKNFLGTLNGLRNGKVLLSLSRESGQKKKRNSKAAEAETAGAPEVAIPLPLIAKANLEPHFEGIREKE